MDGPEGSTGQPGPADRSHRSSVSSVGARAADVLVYLADDSMVPLAVENLPSLSAHELHRAIREVLQLPDIALDAFALWLVSPLLEVQLKPKHQPYKLGRQWQELLLRFTDASDDDVAMDEPSLQFRRNVFFPKRRELQIHDKEVLRLLYEEAKGNVLAARYPCDVEDCEALGALVCRVQLGPYQPGQPTACTLREKLDSFLPAHLCKRSHGLFAAFRGRGAKAGTGEQGLLNAYRRVQEVASSDGEREASLSPHYRAYLLKCHELPFYGCAFFHGEIDKPAQGFLHRGGRKPVSVAISLDGVHVIDCREKHVLLGLRFQELSWDHTSPEEEESVLWLEFDGDNEGTPVNKLLKIYSKQIEKDLASICLPAVPPAKGPPHPDLCHPRVFMPGFELYGRGSPRSVLFCPVSHSALYLGAPSSSPLPWVSSSDCGRRCCLRPLCARPASGSGADWSLQPLWWLRRDISSCFFSLLASQLYRYNLQ
ncbi:FERM domain-containing protein 8 isoform X1 [Ovis aries]|uniref:FERM domain-containing protein 8 isoform X1 n=1 Tax=Ovis aries TaxID=9940 RepID=UPI0029526DCF|nr:FERM domain-containing protein 8 isoform X1 [Ovis aries]